MNEKIVQEILHELFSSLEALDTQSTAILQFLQDKQIASAADLAPYFEQAGNASSVRWRAVRVRIDYLISSAMQAAERDAKKESPKPQQSQEESKDRSSETPRSQATEKDVQAAQLVAPNNKTEANDVSASSEKTQKSRGNNTDASVDADANKDRKGRDNPDRLAGKTEKTENNAA